MNGKYVGIAIEATAAILLGSWFVAIAATVLGAEYPTQTDIALIGGQFVGMAVTLITCRFSDEKPKD